MATKWIKRLHIYVGLLNSTILVVFSIVGLAVTFVPRRPAESLPAADVRYVPFEVPGDLDDLQLARRIQEALHLPLTRPPAKFNLRRGEDGLLRVRLPTPSKLHTVTVLETENRLRIETRPFDVWHYLVRLHTITPAGRLPDWRLRAWSWYVEFALWSLIFMAVTGIWLWLVSRPRLGWAHASFAAGTAAFVLVLVLGR